MFTKSHNNRDWLTYSKEILPRSAQVQPQFMQGLSSSCSLHLCCEYCQQYWTADRQKEDIPFAKGKPLANKLVRKLPGQLLTTHKQVSSIVSTATCHHSWACKLWKEGLVLKWMWRTKKEEQKRELEGGDETQWEPKSSKVHLQKGRESMSVVCAKCFLYSGLSR